MAQDIAQVAGMGNDTGLMVVSSDAIEATNIVVPESDSLCVHCLVCAYWRLTRVRDTGIGPRPPHTPV